jgi:hypothetical protein
VRPSVGDLDLAAVDQVPEGLVDELSRVLLHAEHLLDPPPQGRRRPGVGGIPGLQRPLDETALEALSERATLLPDDEPELVGEEAVFSDISHPDQTNGRPGRSLDFRQVIRMKCEARVGRTLLGPRRARPKEGVTRAAANCVGRKQAVTFRSHDPPFSPILWKKKRPEQGVS